MWGLMQGRHLAPLTALVAKAQSGKVLDDIYDSQMYPTSGAAQTTPAGMPQGTRGLTSRDNGTPKRTGCRLCRPKRLLDMAESCMKGGARLSSCPTCAGDSVEAPSCCKPCRASGAGVRPGQAGRALCLGRLVRCCIMCLLTRLCGCASSMSDIRCMCIMTSETAACWELIQSHLTHCMLHQDGQPGRIE